MSKPERGSQSPSSPSTSKLPKFLQKTSRDRSRSMVDTSGSSSTIASSSSSPVSESSKSSNSRQIGRGGPGKKLFGSKDEKRRQSQDIVFEGPGPSTPGSERERTASPDVVGQDEPPVIVEPVSIPRPRTRSERPLSDNYPVSFYPSSSTSRISDLPSRLSGWFSHTFSTSSADLSLPSLISQQHLNSVASPSKSRGTSALLAAAKHGKDRAMRFILDSDATPDNCTDMIWILGIEHIGYEPPSPTVSPPNGRRTSVVSRRSPSSYRTSPPPDPSLSQSQPPSSKKDDPGRHWPPVFYADFTSRIWLTYRSQFHPIRDTTIEELEAADAAGEPGGVMSSSPPPKRWNWPLGGEKGWSSDAGWGCMLRTGQSLLANTLLHLHLGRDWRKPPYPIYTADYATYVQILTWFLDDPSPVCPFSVHRMALVGKQLGVRVGQWFGPSTAAGAIKKLVHSFPDAGLGVYVAADTGTIYESEVYAASHSGIGSPKRSHKSWGDRAVLVLIGHRLGINGVNPIYYDTLRELYTWPQGVGIAGGRPSSSYYFVGSQADNLFYLDPHHARPAVPLRPPPPMDEVTPQSASRQTSPEPAYSSDRERDRMPKTPVRHVRSPTSPSSLRSSTGSNSSAYSHRAVPSPSPLQHQISASSTSSGQSSASHLRWQSSSVIPDGSSMDSRELEGDLSGLDPVQRHYVTAYSHAELSTFHCDRVRKMPLSGLDPSMLMGFLCKDEQEWLDFRYRVTQLNKRSGKATVFNIQDEPPNWASDSEMDLRSMSDHDIDIDLPEDDEDEVSSSDASRAASVSSPDTSISARGGADTEEDPLGPITPGAKTSFDFDEEGLAKLKLNRSTSETDKKNSLSFDDEDDEEWLDTSETPQTPLPTWNPPPIAQHSQRQFSSSASSPHTHAPPITPSRSSSSSISRESSTSADSGAPPRERRRTKKSTSSGHTITRSSSSHHSQALPPPLQVQQPQYPFPATHPEEDFTRQANPNSGGGGRVPKMRTAVARDGGRTQSGGIKGLIPDDTDDT